MGDKNINKVKKKAKLIALGTSVVGIVTIVSIVTVAINENRINYKKNKQIVEAKELDEERSNDNSIINNKNHTYMSEKNAVDPSEVRKMINGNYDGSLKDEKIIFLTFDDGPSVNTEKILNILKEKNVNATFFVLGQNIGKTEENKELIKRMINEGNSIGNHTYTHNFSKLYPNKKVDIDYFMKEYKKNEDELKSILGEGFKNNLVRLPGGENTRQYFKDSNLSSFLDKLNENGISSVDWNSLNGDAEGKSYSVEEMINYVKRTSENKKHVILLMHDSAPKEKTVQALPEIIDYYKSDGYNFKIIG